VGVVECVGALCEEASFSGAGGVCVAHGGAGLGAAGEGGGGVERGEAGVADDTGAGVIEVWLVSKVKVTKRKSYKVGRRSDYGGIGCELQRKEVIRWRSG